MPVSHYAISEDIHVYPSFLRMDEIDYLLELYEAHPNPHWQYPFWAGIARFPPWSDDRYRAIYRRCLMQARVHVPGGLLTAPCLARWPDGHQGMTPHLDIGVDLEFPERDWVCMVYLNEGYSGGELIFANENRLLKPELGMIVAFKGGLVVRHGVAPIHGAPRYTGSFWICEPNNPRKQSIWDHT